MKNQILPLSIVLLFLLMSSCSPDDIPQERVQNESGVTGEVIRNPKTKVVPIEAQNLLVGKDSNHLVFDGKSSFIDNIHVGDIIVSGPTEIAPSGFLRMVNGISKEHEQTIFSTRHAKLDEALDVAEFTYHFEVNPQKGNRVDGFYWDINELLEDKDGDPNTLFDNFSIDGSLDMDLEGEVTFSLSRQLFKFEIWVDGDMVSHVKSGGSLGTLGLEVNAIQARQPLLFFMLGGFPFVLRPVINVVVGGTGYINGEYEATHILGVYGTAYIENVAGEWRGGSGIMMSNDFQFNGSYTSKVRGYMGPELQFWLYDYPGVAATIGTYGYLEYEYNSSTDYWSLTPGIQGAAKAEVALFDWFNLLYSKEIFDYRTDPILTSDD